eukprot:138767_1
MCKDMKNKQMDTTWILLWRTTTTQSATIPTTKNAAGTVISIISTPGPKPKRRKKKTSLNPYGGGADLCGGEDAPKSRKGNNGSKCVEGYASVPDKLVSKTQALDQRSMVLNEDDHDVIQMQFIQKNTSKKCVVCVLLPCNKNVKRFRGVSETKQKNELVLQEIHLCG